jgi:phage/conjugal plasmid C-4 type zinc finger TraR family protein
LPAESEKIAVLQLLACNPPDVVRPKFTLSGEHTMADTIDMAQERQALMPEKQIAHARPLVTQASAQFCIDCDGAIPEVRRRAIPGVSRCVACQEIAEAQQRHFIRR